MAQDGGRVRRIAYLGTSVASRHLVEAFVTSLPEQGWSVGRNLVFDARYTESDADRLPALTAELLALKPHVFVSATDVYARDAASSGTGVPVVFVLGFDPVGLGLVKSLRAPGGRSTGYSVLNWELNPKRLALLREAVPRVGKVGVLHREGDPNARAALALTEKAGRDLGIGILPAPVRRLEDFSPALGRLAQAGARGVLNVPDSLFFRWREQLADLAVRHRLAAMFGATEYADAGMLLAYGTDFKDVYSRAARLVSRILEGADPATTPVEQANTYELVVNLRTARSLGLELPRSVMLQATRVIE